jgi:tol-pal system protein YbgF
MIRHSLLACFGAALGLAVAAAPSWSQDRSAQERLDRLERDLNMLQRQIYRGGPPPMIGGDPNAAVNTELRLDRIEAQMRELTGRVEEYLNQIAQLRQRLDQVSSDIDVRLSQTSPTPGPYASAAPRARAPAPPSGRSAPSEPPSAAAGPLPLPSNPAAPPSAAAMGPPLPPGTAVQPPPLPSPSGPTPVFGTLTPPGMAPAAPPRGPEPAAAGAPPPPPGGGQLPSGSATEQYNYAYGLLKQADYPAAETAFKAFIEQHPRDALTASAQFWVGETYYRRGKYIEAAAAFAEGYKRYPKGPKAADELLKMAMSLARANQKQNACVALAQLDKDFPSPSAPIRDHAAAEKKRLGC